MGPHRWNVDGSVCETCRYKCDHEYDVERSEEDSPYWHVIVCRKCGYRSSRSHEFNDQGECECGYTYTCQHEYKYERWTNEQHKVICKKCKTESLQTHKWGVAPNGKVKYYEDGRLWQKCGCGEERTIMRSTATSNTYMLVGKTSHYVETMENGEKVYKPHQFENGVCTDCGYECEHTYYNRRNATEHWRECTICGMIVDRAQHTAGKCECGYEASFANCEHQNYIWKNNELMHWQECANCGQRVEDTKDIHEFSGATCVTCSYQEKCTHSYENKKDSTYHWKECKNCGLKTEKEKHNYINGECECGAKEIQVECEHTNREWKADSSKHWQVCKDCGQEISETRGEHVYVNGKCKNCGLADNTGSNDKLPNTGENKVIIGIVIVLICTTVGAIGAKKYKNIL